MNNNVFTSIYHELGIRDPELMQAKAIIVAEIYRILQSRNIDASAAGNELGLSEGEMYSILQGQFERYSASVLMEYADKLKLRGHDAGSSE